jgi:hypothetical protein
LAFKILPSALVRRIGTITCSTMDWYPGRLLNIGNKKLDIEPSEFRVNKVDFFSGNSESRANLTTKVHRTKGLRLVFAL